MRSHELNSGPGPLGPEMLPVENWLFIPVGSRRLPGNSAGEEE